MLELCASRQKPPSQRPQRVRVLAVPASSTCQLAAGAASRYALGAGGVGALRARRLRRARSPPRVTRSAHGAARLCAGPPRAAQPLAAIDASRYALGADGVGAARPGACGALAGKSLPACPCAGCASMPARSWRRLALRARRRWRGRCAPGRLRQPSRGHALRARRRWRGRCAPGRLRQPSRGHSLRARHRWRGRCAPGRLHVFTPDNARVASWWMSLSKTSCASRRSRGSVHKALRAPAECEGGEGGLRHHHAQACRGTLACYRSMCSVSRRGAPLQPERPTPRPGRPPAL